eukprot:scaffold3305_cov328-Pinguiococcus_pyrenoidosus.AAC.5
MTGRGFGGSGEKKSRPKGRENECGEIPHNKPLPPSLPPAAVPEGRRRSRWAGECLQLHPRPARLLGRCGRGAGAPV